MRNRLSKDKTSSFALNTSEDTPRLYQVMLHHDEFTTMEFVLEILETLFYMDRHKAVDLMLEAKEQGRAFCGLFSKDVAATKIAAVSATATDKEFPLVCSMEAV